MVPPIKEPYCSLEELLSNPAITAPEALDSINFQYSGIQFHVYGVLHGLTGGTNRAYRQLVNHTIKHAKGLRFAEKDMCQMYRRLDGEVHDWVQLPFWDAAKIAFSLIANPHRVGQLLALLARERFTKEDRFGKGGLRRIQDLGGSAYFHRLHPNVRRTLTGLPSPKEYFLENLKRRAGTSKLDPARFADPDWYWLSYIEPYVNIPCRSIHMLEYAVAYVQRHDLTEISLFVGETHNSDIAWFAGRKPGDLPPEAEAAAQAIKQLAEKTANRRTRQSRIPLKVGIALGACTAIWLNVVLVLVTAYLVSALVDLIQRYT